MKIVFFHYRIGERDGVSLEIDKRAQIFKKLGDEVFFVAGFNGGLDNNVSVIKELDIKSNYNKFLREECFYKKHFDEDFLISFYFQLENKIYKKINTFLTQVKPDLIFVHNLFSHAMQLPATTALIKTLDKWQIKTVAVHHDFWFERSFFKKPKYFFIQEILNSLPPSRPYILAHQVINSRARKELFRRRNIEAEVIGDYFDFEKPVAKIDNFNKDLRKYFKINDNDILVLHATRITARKNIENALIFSRELEKSLRSQAPINILGRNFKKDSKVVVLLPNFVEVDDLDYYKNLKRLGEKLKVNVIFAWEHFALNRRKENGIKIYSLWDAYLFADLVTYTSSWEGFGNQFLEAVHFKKIPVIFEYPVFKSDIKKEGYQYISLGDKLQKRNGFLLVPKNNIESAVRETIKLFKNEFLINQMVEKNFLIAKKNHSLENLEQNLKKIRDKI